MNYDKVIGIDPGASGGIAVWTKNGLGCKKMPTYEVKKKKLTKNGNPSISNETDIRGLQDIFLQQKQGYNPIIFLERVQMWHGDSKDENAGKQFRIAKLLANYEKLKAVIEICDIPYVQVMPKQWQSYLNLVLKGKSDADRKRRYIRFASEKYQMKAVAWNGDAICLVQFGREKLYSDPAWVNKYISRTHDPKLL